MEPHGTKCVTVRKDGGDEALRVTALPAAIGELKALTGLDLRLEPRRAAGPRSASSKR